MKYSFGIMQGRLTPSNGRGIQFFPFDNWENEFLFASEAGLNEIEFIFDLDHYEQNPLWSESGIKQINNQIKKNRYKSKSYLRGFFYASAFFSG